MLTDTSTETMTATVQNPDGSVVVATFDLTDDQGWANATQLVVVSTNLVLGYWRADIIAHLVNSHMTAYWPAPRYTEAVFDL